MTIPLNIQPVTYCPQCRQPLTQVGKHWVCLEHGEVSPKKPSAPLRIFLSYGHDANEELVVRIKADLEKRGHDVWFDKSEIKAGDDWRRSITEGIARSDKFVSFLSKHSTRDPGVCRDEIAIAIGVKGGNIQTILVESEQEVQPPVNIGHLQWLDMHDWKERRAAGEAAWEQWYQAKLAEIVRVVESDESRRFAGEIETLNGHLKPIKSEARICQLLSKGFCGRRWLFQAVENWHTASRDRPSGTDSRLFWIMGAPGVGKSAFAAQLTHTRGDTVIAAQFCEWDKPDHRNAPRVVRSLAFQLATRLPDYRKLLLTLPEIAVLDGKDAAELFDYLLANPLRSVINGGRERYLIVIDALDEAGEAGRNPLVEMLARNAQRLPDWLGLVVTSRPEFDVKTLLQALNPFPLDTQSESNRADIRDYLRRELASQLQNRPDADRLVEQILEKSEGVFLYVERFCDDVQRRHLSLDRPEQFPQGLGGIFCQYFQRQFPDLEKFRKDVRPALRAILAAREPLPVEILQRLFNWQDEELRDFTRPLASLFPVAKENGCEVIKPYHKSLADWLTDEAMAGKYFVSLTEGHRTLAHFCSCWWRHADSFALSELVYHLVASECAKEAAAVLLDSLFINLKMGKFGWSKICDDFELAEQHLLDGRLGLASAACHFLQKAEQAVTRGPCYYGDERDRIRFSWLVERRELFHAAITVAPLWTQDGVSAKACAIFGARALQAVNLGYPEVPNVVATLCRYIAHTSDTKILTDMRDLLRPALFSAKNAPRRKPEGFAVTNSVSSAHLYEDYVEESLSAADAALALQPLRLIRCLFAARRLKAWLDCDTDPAGALQFALERAGEDLSELPDLVRSLLDLSTEDLQALANP